MCWMTCLPFFRRLFGVFQGGSAAPKSGEQPQSHRLPSQAVEGWAHVRVCLLASPLCLLHGAKQFVERVSCHESLRCCLGR